MTEVGGERGKPIESAWPGIGTYVESYESAWARDGSAEPAEHVAPSDHPRSLDVLCELVRVDMEYRWERGQPRRLDHYQSAYPTLFDDPALVRDMAFEELRLRRQAGERPDPAEYRQRYGVDLGPAPEPSSAVGAEPPPSARTGMEAAASAYLAYRRADGSGTPGLDLVLDSFQVPREQSEFLRRLDRDDPHAAERLAEAVAGLPRVGSSFLGFRLCRELGRGAFGRVYLARQGDLANRLVALKVSADVVSETHALAQLQHTNIVPVYSVHRRGPFQAVCMPYLGATTLADSLAELRSQPTLPGSGAGLLSTLRGRANGPDSTQVRDGSRDPAPAPAAMVEEPPRTIVPPRIERLKELPYVPAVLWLVARVADGLAHAHERGILHRDLKPANILFADDGEPLLLDFSLAADLKASARAGVALVGGTLPYMAPEQIRSYRDDRVVLDARSDVYSLGVILYELLTGSPPFPVARGTIEDVLPEMLADRQAGAPDPRTRNPGITPATAAIVRHCLEPDPNRRYASARALQEDLKRQLDHLPLRHVAEPSPRERLVKWARRHPRLTSSTTIALAAGVLVVGLGVALVGRHRAYERVAASAALSRLGGERSEAFALLADPKAATEVIEEGLRVARRVAGDYGIDASADWSAHPLARALPPADRARLQAGLGEILTLAARALVGPEAPRGDAARTGLEAHRYLDAATRCYAPGQAPRALLLAQAEVAAAEGRSAEAATWRRQAEAVPLGSPRERLLGVADQAGPDDRRRLRAFLDAAESLGPHDVDPAHWLILGNWSARLGRPDDARHCYGVAIALAPRSPWAYLNRGLLSLDTGDPAQALHDFDRVAQLRPDWPSIALNRALARMAEGDHRGAIDDLNHGLARAGAPTRAYFVRARAREALGDRAGARHDRDEGLKATPRDATSFVARGLARLPQDPRGAIADFDAALALEPRHLAALQDKASVLSESLGRSAEALQVLDQAIALHPTAVDALAGRAVLRARQGRREDAQHDARAALALTDKALTIYQAACVFALTSTSDPADRPEALRLLAESFRKDASWARIAVTDPDIRPLTGLPEYRKLLDAFAVVNQTTVGARDAP